MGDTPADDATSVRVALRIRPQLSRERIDMCQVCTYVSPGDTQVILGKDKAFTYDYVYDIQTQQEALYSTCARPLIEGCFDGYNATIFAYGQTGSGKTYTMGTGFDVGVTEAEIGIIPRAVEHLFSGIEQRRQHAHDTGEPPPDFKVNAQFMELYNEEVLDLLDTTRDPNDRNRKSHIRIHEDAAGGIYCVGVTTKQVASYSDTMQCLKLGALSRTTASTNMNAQSSRSHAIFTLHIRQQRVIRDEVDGEDGKERDTTEPLNEFETLTAKFHFVDLAGSERLKRTGATGDRQKEGISINCGLLALGNVISALGDKAKKGSHVPYRDSKLTRLLQDSLGGNSRTVMIACVSPSDRDFMETLNTLKYANRARNIQNKVTVNQDKTSKQLGALRLQIQELQVELDAYRTGKRVVDPDGVETINDMFHENTMLQTENSSLRQRVKAMSDTVDGLTRRNSELQALREAANLGNMGDEAAQSEVKSLIEKYVCEIEELRARLIESEAMIAHIKTSASVSARTPSRLAAHSPGLSRVDAGGEYGALTSPTDNDVSQLITAAKRDLKKQRERTKSRSRTRSCSSDKENHSEEEKQDTEGAEEPGDLGQGHEQISGDEDDDEEDVDDGLESPSESEEAELKALVADGSKDDDPDNLHEDLADLTCEISIKQKLIEELEMSQKRLHTMKIQYEEKLVSLTSRIRHTEIERDRVLSNLGNIESQGKDQAKKIRDDYEKKINDMNSDLKKVQAAKKEHAKLLRNQSHYEKQLKSLQKDLGDMKKYKVKLMNQIKEESQRHRQSEAKRSKEIAQLRKEQLKKTTQIKSLEADKRQKELILRRKQEEVQALRKRQKSNMSAATAGRVGKYERPTTVPINPISSRRKKEFNPKAAKSKWDNLEKAVTSVVIRKQTVGHMERDMERWLKQRETLRRKIDKFSKKRDKAVKEKADEEFVRDLTEQIDSLRENITYVQDNINECQSNVMQMEEENKDEESEPASLLDKCSSVEEAKYLLEHFINLTINKGMVAAAKEAENKELLAKLHQERMDSTFQRDMLQYLIQDKVDIEIDDSLMRHRDDSDSGSDTSSGTNSPIDSLMENNNKDFAPIAPATSTTSPVAMPTVPLLSLPPTMTSTPHHGAQLMSQDSVNTSTSSIAGRSVKVRRKITTPADLLGASAPIPTDPPGVPPEDPRRLAGGGGGPGGAEGGTGTKRPDPGALMPPPKMPPKSRVGGGSYTQLPRMEAPTRPSPSPSPSLPRRSLPTASASATAMSKSETASPQPRRRMTTSTSSGTLSRHGSTGDTTDVTPPSSPTLARRNRSNNVFSRLTSQSQPASPHPTRGVITAAAAANRAGFRSAPLVHSHTAMGHSKAVLSVYATEELMFSSSKDRTAKVWDLETGEEILTLDGHPNNVVCVRYSEETSLAYTASTYFVKVWDLRQGNSCITTVMSSGLTNELPAPSSSSTSRQVTCPPGEMDIKDIALNSTGGVLYTAAGNTVRIWDCRSWKSVGKLSGGHQAAVMVLAVDDTDTADGNICVVTGSKDHYIKVFEVMEDSTGVLCPKFNLEPPHYDGIQSLCLMGDLLYSGSRDMCIKKWDLAEQSLKQSINNAHKDWICGLAFMPGGNCLLSGCRGGYIKLWHIDNCAQLGEIKAHNSPINSVTTNSQMIFTASNDRSVRIWKTRGNIDGYESSDHE